MKIIHFQYTPIEDAISILYDEFGKHAPSVSSLIRSQVTMYQGGLTEKWRYWDLVTSQINARRDASQEEHTKQPK